jgi:membrane-associated phospholipid phosphatase
MNLKIGKYCSVKPYLLWGRERAEREKNKLMSNRFGMSKLIDEARHGGVTARDRAIIRAARIFSGLFSPFYLPLLGVALLFVFSYLSLLSPKYKLFTLLIVYAFTILVPKFTIFVYRKLNGWQPLELYKQSNRLVPYILTIASYLCCIYLIDELRIPHYMGCIVVAGLVLQIVCAIINHWWKISMHTAAVGGATGAIIAFSFIYNFDPTWWLSIALLLSGCVGTSRIILRRHSLEQVSAGFFVGCICGFIGIIFL